MMAPPSRSTVRVPLQPSFTSADVASLLKRHKSVIHYWLKAGKLTHHQNFRGHVYVMREDLQLFVNTYLKS